MNNLMFDTNNAIYLKSYQDGLSSYTQSNCQVTLTDNGYRIYRPPNLTTANNGNTMYGGLKIINSYSTSLSHTFNDTDNRFNLQKGHTYIICFNVRGQSSNAFSSFGWTNQMGWGGGGLSPTPSNVQNCSIPSNFEGEKECWHKFTINDDISKICTTTYSYATQGNEYLSYTHFAVGFSYTSTGSLGTDLYITNLRMYDITSLASLSITRTGILKTMSPIEDLITNKFHILGKTSETIGGQFYEY